MGKQSCSSESYVNHPMKSSSLERHRKAKRNPLEISQNFFLYPLLFFFYYKTACSIFNLYLIYHCFFFLLFLFFQTAYLEAVDFLDIFLYFVKLP